MLPSDMADNADGWTTVQSNRLSQAQLDKLSWQQRKKHELQVVREWENNPNSHWSGT
jgi:hypothetical protein